VRGGREGGEEGFEKKPARLALRKFAAQSRTNKFLAKSQQVWLGEEDEIKYLCTI
jgi:hypothetical protein